MARNYQKQIIKENKTVSQGLTHMYQCQQVTIEVDFEEDQRSTSQLRRQFPANVFAEDLTWRLG